MYHKYGKFSFWLRGTAFFYTTIAQRYELTVFITGRIQVQKGLREQWFNYSCDVALNRRTFQEMKRYLMWLAIPLYQLFSTLVTKLRLPLLITRKWSKIFPFHQEGDNNSSRQKGYSLVSPWTLSSSCPGRYSPEKNTTIVLIIYTFPRAHRILELKRTVKTEMAKSSTKKKPRAREM